jgi:hypothetical protein|nr:MAG TPA: major tail protein [Caudoviricetes sp.]
MADELIKHDTNEDVLRGQLFIFINKKPIAFASNAVMDMTTEEVDASNKMTGNWNAPLPGKNGYTVSSEAMVSRKAGQMSIDTLIDIWRTQQTVEFFFGEALVTDPTNMGGFFDMDLTKKYYTGIMMITSLNLTSTVGSLASSSASFSGIGALVPHDGTTPTT